MSAEHVGGNQNSTKTCWLCGEPVDAVQLPKHINEVHGGGER